MQPHPTPTDANQVARPALTAEQHAVLAADSAIAARYDELLASTLADKGSPFWGFRSEGRYVSHGCIIRHAIYTVGLDRRRAEIAVERAQAKAA